VRNCSKSKGEDSKANRCPPAEPEGEVEDTIRYCTVQSMIPFLAHGVGMFKFRFFMFMVLTVLVGSLLL